MSERVTPMMSQYLELKARHPNDILLFRMGDFYEMFFEDAKDAVRILGITLTTRGRHRGEPIPMAGVPWHSVEGYVEGLVEAGRRVAICEQIEDPRHATGIVKRAVTEVVTPGTFMASETNGRLDRFVAALAPGPDAWGLALVDVSTAEFWAGEFPEGRIADELGRFRPRELLLPEGVPPPEGVSALPQARLDEWAFHPARAADVLCRQLGTASLDGFGCGDLTTGVGAAGALVRYLSELKGDALRHLTRLRRLDARGVLTLDAASLRHLEVASAPDGGHSLVSVLDRTRTAMGARFLRHALTRPLADVAAIRARHDAVGALVEDAATREALGEELAQAYDLERLAGRLGTRRAGPRDALRLAHTLRVLPDVRARVRDMEGRLAALCDAIDPLTELCAELDRALSEEPPFHVGDGGTFRPGYAEALDTLRDAAAEGRAWIARLETDERARTGIANLKVGFNRVFGYYLEVTRANLSKVPEDYQRKQTLVNAERFVTDALKRKEADVLGAEERQIALERELFDALLDRAAAAIPILLRTAQAIAEIDTLVSFADVAVRSGYVKPEVHEGQAIHIEGGRHAVVERHLEEGTFIPNDCHVDGDTRQILLITGPNMAGKSTYLRQVGLIVLLAQAGAFVPASRASIGIADRIFTRVGAGDNVARGQSTFLVEMHESANILHNATSRSLVLLDEVGRGTSTFDGLSIAWAMTEHLHDGMAGRPRTLFATHFHELTSLSGSLARLVNLRVDVDETEHEVLFLRKIVEGRADRSYGIHVAKMAGLPASVLARAEAILETLEAGRGKGPSPRPDPVQGVLPLAAARRSAVEEALSAIDPDRVSPMEALALLQEWRDSLKPREP